MDNQNNLEHSLNTPGELPQEMACDLSEEPAEGESLAELTGKLMDYESKPGSEGLEPSKDEVDRILAQVGLSKTQAGPKFSPGSIDEEDDLAAVAQLDKILAELRSVGSAENVKPPASNEALAAPSAAPLDSAPPPVPLPAAAEDSHEPEQVALRIAAFKSEMERPRNKSARAMGLVVSLGVTVALVIYGFFKFGSELVLRTGQRWLLPLCLFLGVLVGFWLGYLLIKPILRDR